MRKTFKFRFSNQKDKTDSKCHFLENKNDDFFRSRKRLFFMKKKCTDKKFDDFFNKK